MKICRLPIIRKATTQLPRPVRDILVTVWNIPSDICLGLVAALPHHPGPYMWLKRLMLSMLGMRIGTNVHIFPGVRIYVPRSIEIGSDVSLSANVVLVGCGEKKIRIGDHSISSIT